MKKRTVTALIGVALAAAAMPAGAGAEASDQASCVGQGASSGEPGQKDDFIRNFIRATSGREFGEFVSNAARSDECNVPGR